MKVVLVEFPRTEEIWDIVVVQSEEDCVVEEENIETFLMEYNSILQWKNAQERFAGLVEYKIRG